MEFHVSRLCSKTTIFLYRTCAIRDWMKQAPTETKCYSNCSMLYGWHGMWGAHAEKVDCFSSTCVVAIPELSIYESKKKTTKWKRKNRIMVTKLSTALVHKCWIVPLPPLFVVVVVVVHFHPWWKIGHSQWLLMASPSVSHSIYWEMVRLCSASQQLMWRWHRINSSHSWHINSGIT